MASILTPYLSFRDSAREALQFYQQVFGGELTISTFGESGMTEGDAANLVMHGQLETPSGYTLMAADTPPGMELGSGSSITVCLSGDDVDDLRRYFAGLTEGGTITTPLEKQMWGDEYGACTDRFGVNWMTNISLPQG
ncbi:MAG: PhnB protein; putative DNA binding 3-demethylubiquinone-9 3-methyltransferase domain protein [uncultured Friedmanniella sp.]|uniref:PhnB protein putative DNA binding 3-demethylubiquinone-9 3-methyltransferase domain protein n=1 Tax=uncultured Friedmanniella sp. TaxID=335381 RepID=A0A6J4KME5_9ACTN|nr:VOC family protein [uncultured Friedmanniella sp.]CAA9309989.1 MAG: PhnB protein; putative DNA binding 3-demethylubiquinone-9 3-methyltransferase domain protein [uncultured Friedmanniella sp.]